MKYRIPEIVIGCLITFAAYSVALIFLASPQSIGSHGGGQTHEGRNVFEKFWEWTTDDPVAVYTLVLALSTIGLWVVTGRGIRNQSRETRILQRAYLSVEPGAISASSDPKKCHPNIVIRNVGNLPARKTRWVIDWKVSQDHRLNDFPIGDSKLEGENTLPPGGEMKQGGPIIYLSNEPGDLRNELGLYLYVWGTVVYDDGFGTERHTRFCHRYNTINLENAVSQGLADDAVTVVTKIVGKVISPSHARYHRFGNDAT